ncbi:MAG: alpha/beta fold hydrolase [Candidatus Kaiserbacteria bacterium]|nr:alpha/beta fold hydrolase [Candidatus Kaiserbacteria bacterium]
MPPRSEPSSSAPFTVGSPDSPRRVLIIHGYTGSPDEFRELAHDLAQRLSAYVSVPLLPGHGTTLADLERTSYKQLIDYGMQKAREMAAAGKPLAIIGHSFGGYIAALAAEEIKLKALVLAVTPYRLKWPIFIPGMELVMRMRTEWRKKMSEEEREARKGLFYYPAMPGRALGYLKRGIRAMRLILPSLKMPILTIHTRNDQLTYSSSGSIMLKKSGGNPENKSIVLEHRRHGIFYGVGKEEVVRDISDFLAKVMLR